MYNSYLAIALMKSQYQLWLTYFVQCHRSWRFQRIKGDFCHNGLNYSYLPVLIRSLNDAVSALLFSVNGSVPFAINGLPTHETKFAR